MREQLDAVRAEAMTALEAAREPAELEALRVRYLGKKGALTALLSQLGTLSAGERPIMGQLANAVRQDIEEAMRSRSAAMEKSHLAERLRRETVDVTLPGHAHRMGHTHPMSLVLDEVEDIFVGMGFQVVEGPEVEDTWHCFTALNTDENHPARDRQDTFYITDDVVLRTQTSSVQIRHMRDHKPPIRIISPGRVYRKDEVDATHSPLFHQIEGLVVDRGITMGHLKGTLETWMKALYGPEIETRFRPHHFPYTEPSAEMDFQCHMCHGAGCRVCKGEGWIELGGCGMVHPKVLSVCGIDPDVYSGFAFGFGVERITLRRFAIDDLRLLFGNDLRFLQQF